MARKSEPLSRGLLLSLGIGLCFLRSGTRDLRFLREKIKKIGLLRCERRLCRLRFGWAPLGRSHFRRGSLSRCFVFRHQRSFEISSLSADASQTVVRL